MIQREPSDAGATDLALARVEAHYRHDARGRLTALNQFDGGAAPLFYLQRVLPTTTAPDGRVIARVRADVPDPVAEQLLTLAALEVVPRDWRIPPEHGARYRALLEAFLPTPRNAPVVPWFGPAWRFPPDWQAPAVQVADVSNVVIDQCSAHLLAHYLSDWLGDVDQRDPFLASVVDDTATAVCASSRSSECLCEAGVETAPAFRRQGHARLAVCAWAAAVASGGRTAFYSTSWRNDASLALASGLKLIPFASDYHLG